MPEIVKIRNRATAQYLAKIDSSIRNVVAAHGAYSGPLCLVLMTLFCEFAKAWGRTNSDCHNLLDSVWDATLKVEAPEDMGDLADTKVEIES